MSKGASPSGFEPRTLQQCSALSPTLVARLCRLPSNGVGSSIGRARDCESRSCGFEPRPSPCHLFRSVAQFGQRTCLGRRGPQVRILSLRLVRRMLEGTTWKSTVRVVFRPPKQFGGGVRKAHRFGHKPVVSPPLSTSRFSRGCAGTGRRTRLRSARAQALGGSNPSSRIRSVVRGRDETGRRAGSRVRRPRACGFDYRRPHWVKGMQMELHCFGARGRGFESHPPDSPSPRAVAQTGRARFCRFHQHLSNHPFISFSVKEANA